MKKLILGNWKMNLGYKASVDLAREYIAKLTKSPYEVGACPTSFALPALAEVFAKSGLVLGAQNCFWEVKGAYTGEISPADLLELGCKYSLIGHSERRQYLGESCRMVNLKAKQAIANGLVPVVCVGESRDKREAKKHLAFVAGQLKRGLAGYKGELVVAYEPIWAIGTGLAATNADVVEMHAHIRKELSKILGQEDGAQVRILYGGSVNAQNAKELLNLANVDGLLVGGASLKIEDFAKVAGL